MQLSGELAKISLQNLLQLVRSGHLTGEISLLQGARCATIYVEQGRIKHATLDAEEGADALLELFLWQTGSFSFIEGDLQAVPATIEPHESIDRLLKEGLAYAEEKKYLDELKINSQTILRRLSPANPDRIPLFEKIDGVSTLAELLAGSGLSKRQYVKALFNLVADGLAAVSPPDANQGEIKLPGWVIARLRQDNSDISQAIVDMVIWVDRVKCWMYQADADLTRIIDGIADGDDSEAQPGAGEQSAAAADMISFDSVNALGQPPPLEF